MSGSSAPHDSQSVNREIVFLLTAASVVAAYTTMRYGALWGEADTHAFAIAIRAMLAEARLVPVEHAYTNGYGFPTLATFLLSISGRSVFQLQIAGGALLAVWVVIPAWLAYRELTGSARGATLATVIILVQPEFLFPILRGSHEKFTRGLMFVCLYVLVHSIVSRRKWRRFAAFLLVFYLASYALITFNNLLSVSFIVALGLALVGSVMLRRVEGSQSDVSTATLRRLLYSVGISLVLAFLFTFYAYPPALHAFRIAETFWDRLIVLFLGVEEGVVNPYQTIATAWTSLLIYFLVSLANWLLLLLSFTLWVRQTFLWLLKRASPREPRNVILWSLYGAFGLLSALSILSDISGAIGNLQLRIFPSFVMIAAAFVADWFIRRQRNWSPKHTLEYGLLAIGIAFLTVMAIVKATNEPALSNKWTYYVPGEFVALDWSRENYPDAPIWAAFDERLRAGIGICCAWEEEGAKFDSFQPDLGTRNYLISDVIRARGERSNLSLPIEGDSLRVYDNGTAELYRLRPRTPFQR